MKKPAFTALLAATASALFAATIETDWCTITAPDFAGPGDTILVDVTLKKDPAGQKLSTHLHWLKTGSGAFGGTLAWHPHRDATAGATTRFTFKPNINADTMLAATRANPTGPPPPPR